MGGGGGGQVHFKIKQIHVVSASHQVLDGFLHIVESEHYGKSPSV